MASDWSPHLALSHRWSRKLRQAMARMLRRALARSGLARASVETLAEGESLSTPGFDCTTAWRYRPPAAATPQAAVGDGILARIAPMGDAVLAWLDPWAEQLDSEEANASYHRSILAATMQDPTPQGYLGIEDRRKRNRHVHARLLPIAEQLAACFGLQRARYDDI